MTNRMHLPKMASSKSVMRASLPTAEDEFNPKKATLQNPSPQTVLQMQQTFGNRTTIQMLRKQTIQRDGFGLADAANQLVAQNQDRKKTEKAKEQYAKNLDEIFTPGEEEAAQMLSGNLARFTQTLSKKKRAGLTVRQLVANPESNLTKQFYAFAETEYATPSLDFLIDVEKYKKNPSVEKAKDIYMNWMQDSWTLNIGDTAKRLIYRNITALSPHGHAVAIGAELDDDDD